MSRPESNSGLTLAELLVALFIGALVMTLLVQGILDFATRSERLSIAKKQNQELASLHGFLRERIKRMEPLSIVRDDSPAILFRASKNQLRLVIAETRYPAKPGLYEQVISILPLEDNKHEISMVRLPLFQLEDFGSNRPGGSNKALLYEGKGNPSFSFSSQSSWQDQWEDSAILPNAIALNMQGYQPLQLAIPPAIKSANTSDRAEDETPDTPGGNTQP